MDDDHVEKVHAVIRENHHLTVHEVSEEVGISKKIVFKIGIVGGWSPIGSTWHWLLIGLLYQLRVIMMMDKLVE
jgi:hypothetical protein